MSAGVSLCSGISCTLVLLSPGIGDRPKCDRGLVPCPLVGSASTVGWSGRAEVLRRRRSCRQHTAGRTNQTLLTLLPSTQSVPAPSTAFSPPICRLACASCPARVRMLFGRPSASQVDLCRTRRHMKGNVLCTADSCLHSSLSSAATHPKNSAPSRRQVPSKLVSNYFLSLTFLT